MSMRKDLRYTSVPPSSSPTDLCLMAPEDTRVTIRPEPVEVGCAGRDEALLAGCGV